VEQEVAIFRQTAENCRQMRYGRGAHNFKFVPKVSQNGRSRAHSAKFCIFAINNTL